MKVLMKAIILARVSTEDQMQEGASIPAQLQRAREHCARKGLEIQSEYQFDESSTKDQRVKFDEVINEIRKERTQIALVVETVDRLQRSFKESVLLDEFSKQGKLEIHFIRENLVIHKDSNSSEIQRWDLAVFVAKSYVLQLSDNVKRSFEHKRRNGEWTGKAPIGYQNIALDVEKRLRKDIVPDPNKAHLIRKMFELYATGNHSTKTIRTAIAKEGLRGSTGKPLALSMVDYILNNPFYHGEMLCKGKLYPHKYLPLISKDLFERCQQIRKGWNKKPFKYASKPYILRGLVRCGKCGCSMSPETAKGKYVYYSCTNAKKELCNEKVYIPEKDLLKPVYEVLEAFERIPQERIDEIVAGLKKSSEAKNSYNRQSVNALTQEYNDLQTKIEKLLDLLIDSSITKDEYDKKLKELKERQHDINLQTEDHTKADESYYITAGRVLSLAKNAKNLFESSEIPEKRAILNFLLQNFIVNGKNPHFTLRVPFLQILQTSKLDSLLRR